MDIEEMKNATNLTVSNISPQEMFALHEAENPQLLYKTLNSLSDHAVFKSDFVSPSNGEEGVLMNDEECDSMIRLLKESDDYMDLENDDYSKDGDSYDDEEESVDDIDVLPEVVQQQNNQGYPAVQHLTKENFQKFVKSLTILKNLKQNVIFENGITYFVSDSKSYICKFNTNCDDISFKIPFVEQQASQLNFLTRSKSAITVVETEDDYTFNDGQFKFQLRKTAPDQSILSQDKFQTVIDKRRAYPVLAEYEFTDKNHLESFLSIIKGVKKSNIGISTTSDNSELVIDRGDINSGKFELLRIPCNIGATNNQPVKTILDSLCLLYDYQKLKITFYYNGTETDSLTIIIDGSLNEDFDITFICTAYRNYLS